MIQEKYRKLNVEMKVYNLYENNYGKRWLYLLNILWQWQNVQIKVIVFDEDSYYLSNDYFRCCCY